MRFIYLVSCIGMLLFTLVGGTHLYATLSPQVPTSLATLGFDVCSSRPCFLGITPGLTPWVQVPQMLRQFGIERNQLAFFISLGKSIHVQIANNSETHVNMIIITNYGAAQVGAFPSAGEFLQRYGLPCSIELDEPVIRMIYPYMSISMNVARSLTPLSPVVSVVQMGRVTPDTCNVGQNAPHNLKWSGFASVHRYRSLLTTP